MKQHAKGSPPKLLLEFQESEMENSTLFLGFAMGLDPLSCMVKLRDTWPMPSTISPR